MCGLLVELTYRHSASADQSPAADAEELLEHGTLTGQRVFEILDDTEPGIAETPC